MKLMLLGVVAILIIAWVLLRRRGDGAAARGPGASGDTRYHAVSIHYAEDACSAAKALTGERFLSEDAPRLPLPACDSSECRCRFTHHKDRRSTSERRNPYGNATFGETLRARLRERRRNRNRRGNADEDPD